MDRYRVGRFAAATVGGLAICLVGMTGSAIAGPAPAGQSRTITCGSLSGVNTDDHTLTFSHCTGPTGGWGTLKAPLTSGITIHWTSHKSTQITYTAHAVKPPAPGCSSETHVAGKVTQTSITGFKLNFAASYCTDSTHHVTLAPNTRAKF
jgi:hypothetical protein